MGGCKQLICFIIFNFSFIFSAKYFICTNVRICRLKVKLMYVNFHIILKEAYCWKITRESDFFQAKTCRPGLSRIKDCIKTAGRETSGK